MRSSVMITFPKDCAVLSKKYPDNYSKYTVTQVTVNLGAQKPCYVIMECPVEPGDLRRHQKDLARVGADLSVEAILNWALLSKSSLDLKPVAAALVRLNAVDMAAFLPVVIEVLSELGSLMQTMFYGMKVNCNVLEYQDGSMVVEVKNVIEPKSLTHYTP